MNEDRIRRLLQDLPREEASPGFTRRVLLRIDRSPRITLLPRLGWTAAALAVTVLLGVGALELERQHERRDANEQLAALRAEQRALADELARLKRQSDELQPVVYLGGDDRADFVLDVGRLGRAGDAPARPVTFHGTPAQPRR